MERKGKQSDYIVIWSSVIMHETQNKMEGEERKSAKPAVQVFGRKVSVAINPLVVSVCNLYRVIENSHSRGSL